MSAFDLRPATIPSVEALFAAHHGYKGVGRVGLCFAVFEDGRPVAAFVWNPPAPGAAKAVCPEAPAGVLALSRMVAVPKTERALKHISKPLRAQMKCGIDRGRWPVLVTYSDASLGHNGFVYSCSGWEKTTAAASRMYEDEAGRRTSPYSSGSMRTSSLRAVGTTTIQRWENWACPRGEAARWMSDHGWRREEIPGKRWASGAQAHRWVRDEVKP